MSTVIMNEKLKEMLLRAVAEFLDSKTRAWYAMRGLPYQQGLLFHGPPGTGKSSFTLSVAGQFGLDVYVLTMSSLNDQSLKTLFAELPERCIVLLEDVDAVGLNRIQDNNADARRSLSQNGLSPTSAIGKVTLSTLLNVLDGLGSPEGRLLIMTTNHVELLDPALIRPGRADIKVDFQLADEDMISQLFFLVYDPRPRTTISGNEPEKDVYQGGEKGIIKDCDLPQLVQEFMAKVPKLEFSPAEIMSLLLANKQSPRHAIASVDTWVERIRKERNKFGKANSCALDSDGFSDH
ncbi:P-loop containing nucleoside triphosphate hydrolase protein [Phaeosphaeriaceae sp. PMI808]|nr:P-loop containing nucleoside triphosphate hydrolase protein [Phaeosphaeriaceae sp. PMI808]